MPHRTQSPIESDRDLPSVGPRASAGSQRGSDRPTAAAERFDPSQTRGLLAEAEHLARYRFAASAAEGKVVLDAGCGWAAGASLLARAGAERVVGVDISETLIETAKEQVAAGVELEVGDLCKLPYEAESFDLVVCFDVIEQVSEADTAFDEMARVLKEDGLLLVSSANNESSLDSSAARVQRFTRAEFWDELFRRFGFVEFYSQQNWLTSMVSNAESLEAADLELEDVPTLKVQGTPIGEEAQWIAVASNVPLRPMTQQAVLTSAADVGEWITRWQAQDRRLQQLQAELAASSTAALTAIERRFVDTRTELAEVERRAAIAERDIELLRMSLSWRMTAPLRGNRFLRWLFRRAR